MTPVEIANIGLIALRQHPIASFEEDSADARTVSSLFFTAARSVLQAWEWNECYADMALPAAATNTSTIFTYVCTLPADCLRVRSCPDLTGTWRVGQRNLYVNDHPPITVIYTRDLFINQTTGVRVQGGEDVAISAPLANAIAMQLALMMTEQLTGSAQRYGDMAVLAKQALTAAKVADNMEIAQVVTREDDWVDV